MALCWEAILFALEQPGSDMVIARKFAPDLRDSTEALFFNCLPKVLMELALAANPRAVVRLGGHVSSFEFHNGSLLKFKGVDDWKKQKSQTLAWVGFDEADEQQEGNVAGGKGGMASRLRQVAPLAAAAERGYYPTLPMRQQMCLASNPEGKNWLWKRFINVATRWEDAEAFISTTLDNPHLPRKFVMDQLSRGVAYVKRYVLCMFEEQAGSIYPEWSPKHVVEYGPKPGAEAPQLLHTMDPGSTKINPTGCVWYALDRPRGRLVAVAEYQAWDLPAALHAKAWRRVERRLHEQGYGRVVRRIADPTTIAQHDRGSNNTLRDIYRREGFSFEPGFSNNHKLRVPPLGELIATGKFVATRACPQLYTQIEGYRWEDQLPQHVDLGEYREKVRKGNDHLVDCSQYAAGYWVRRAKGAEEADERTEMEHFEALIRKQMRAQASARPAAQDGVVV